MAPRFLPWFAFGCSFACFCQSLDFEDVVAHVQRALKLHVDLDEPFIGGGYAGGEVLTEANVDEALQGIDDCTTQDHIDFFLYLNELLAWIVNDTRAIPIDMPPMPPECYHILRDFSDPEEEDGVDEETGEYDMETCLRAGMNITNGCADAVAVPLFHIYQNCSGALRLPDCVAKCGGSQNLECWINSPSCHRLDSCVKRELLINNPFLINTTGATHHQFEH
eukprot:CAMPEP_0171105988 /NCGR_PEP_ID=MMETSP0766_2-20121228/63830_1 /TAXON_ID=439317 /ORGANISM="Gambierdiscus australes, Strain CAWD 149" /LENGTH=221 /DNA_ID=CAMNT_0011566973 /DNA_START=66 /DNA_END=734 /DNA_ORIENTATION=+